MHVPRSVATAPRAFGPIVLLLQLLSVACGARTGLLDGAPVVEAADAGAESGTSGVSPGTVDADPDAGSSPDAGRCASADLSTWRRETYRDPGDFERFAVDLSGSGWVALKARDGGVVLAELGLDEHGITWTNRFELPDSPVYPVALDGDATHLVLLTTTGINWNGDVALWRIDRGDHSVVRRDVGNPPGNPNSTIGTALGIAGEQTVVAFGYATEGQGTIEIRDAELELVSTRSVAETHFLAVRAGPNTIDLYTGQSARFRVENGTLEDVPIDSSRLVLGGLGPFLVEADTDFQLTDGERSWRAPWPGTQIAPPAVVRTFENRAVFSIETSLTAVVGHVVADQLQFLAIPSLPDAPGLGVGMLPKVGADRLGIFYLGLEIPRPEQPVRYFGLVCP